MSVSFVSKAPSEPDQRPSVSLQYQTELDAIVDVGRRGSVTKTGHLYVVLGDSLQGFYIVKCLSAHDDHFTGKYLCQIFEGEADGQQLLFKESKDKDRFHYSSLVSEIFGSFEVHEKNVGFPVFSVGKTELDEILVTVAEMEEI